ncbi:hypothetical protein BANRA_05316 [Escherichia coli]|nr:hypothetical protein BANRA_05316 [Escherichia coli]
MRLRVRPTFDMRGGQGRQPLDVPLDGRVRHHCVFARMPGVFEPCTRLDHMGWLRYLASQTPLSRSIGSLASCSATGPFGSCDLGIIEQQLNQSSEPAWFPSLCPVVMHSPVTGLFRVLWIGFFFPPSVPASKSNVRLGIPNRLSIHIAMYG